jgi:hypothetical protein
MNLHQIQANKPLTDLDKAIRAIHHAFPGSYTFGQPLENGDVIWATEENSGRLGLNSIHMWARTYDNTNRELDHE